jgi:hypothetical protein
MWNPKQENVQRIPIGNYPKAMGSVQGRVREYRFRLEKAILAVRGRVDLEDCHLVDVATGHHLHELLARWLLRTRFTEMKPSEIIGMSSQMNRAKEARNKAVHALRIGSGKTKSPLASFYADDNDADADELTNTTPTIAPNASKDVGSTSESPSAPDALEGLLGDDTNDSTNGA